MGWGLGCVCGVFCIVALPAAFAPHLVKTYGGGDKTENIPSIPAPVAIPLAMAKGTLIIL